MDQVNEAVKLKGKQSEIERQEQGLMQFDVGKRNFGIIAGSLGYIVTNNEFCYQERSLNENIELQANWPYQDEGRYEFKVLTLAEIRAVARPITSYREWAHYWGIKDRIFRNYVDMATRARELGANISAMPEWGEEVKPNEARNT